VILATRVMSTLIVVLGVAIVVVGIAREDVVRVLVGVLFVAAGAGRLWLARRRA
jgi:hypothetical protein